MCYESDTYCYTRYISEDLIVLWGKLSMLEYSIIVHKYGHVLDVIPVS